MLFMNEDICFTRGIVGVICFGPHCKEVNSWELTAGGTTQFIVHFGI